MEEEEARAKYHNPPFSLVESLEEEEVGAVGGVTLLLPLRRKLMHSMVATATMEFRKYDQSAVVAEAPLLYSLEQNQLVQEVEEEEEEARQTPSFQHVEEWVAKALLMQLHSYFASSCAFQVCLRGSPENEGLGDEIPTGPKLVFSSATAVVCAERDSYLSFQHRLLL